MKKIIVTIAVLIAINIQAETIPIGQTLSWAITADTAEYQVSNYNTTTGDWTINVQLNIISPLQGLEPEDARIDVSTYYQCVVLGSEIAAYLGVEAGTVSENFTGSQIDTAVQAIAFAKTMAAYGFGD